MTGARTVRAGRSGLGLAVLLFLAAPLRAGVTEILARLRADQRARPQRLEDLHALGSAAAGEVAGLLSGRNAQLGLLGADEREILLQSLRSWPAKATVEALLALPPEPSLDDRLTALRLVGEVGDKTAVVAVDFLCKGLAPEQVVHPLVGAELQRTLLHLMRRDAETVDEIYRLLQQGQLCSELLQPLAGAIGQVPSAAGLGVLERLLGRSDELDRVVLEALGNLRFYGDARGLDEAVRTVRLYLSSSHPRMRRQAALSLGSMRASGSVADLIALLDDVERRVQRAAHWSLGRISGLELPADPEAWTRWHEAELEWLDTRCAALIESLEAGEAARVIDATRMLSLHPVHAASACEALEGLLEHEDALVVSAACSALAKLDSVGSFGLLVQALDDPRAEVRRAAARCLEILTGQRLGTESGAWLAWLVPAV